jgi:DNA-binding GntR family transcriptional regulator
LSEAPHTLESDSLTASWSSPDWSPSFRNAVETIRRIVAERHDRPSLVSRIACEVGAELIEGVRQEGEDLNSVELAQKYETSRTPVREALMLLEKEGLVDIPPRRRPRVAVLDPKEVKEIYTVRAALFAQVAEDVAINATPDQIAELRAILVGMQEAAVRSDLDTYLWGNVAFYNFLTVVGNNRVAKRIIDSLLLRTLRLRRLSLSLPHRLEKSIANHVQLVDAFADRDAPLAAALIRSNHLHALDALTGFMATRQQRPANGRTRTNHNASHS